MGESSVILAAEFDEEAQHSVQNSQPPRFPRDSRVAAAVDEPAAKPWNDVHVINCTVLGAGSSGVLFRFVSLFGFLVRFSCAFREFSSFPLVFWTAVGSIAASRVARLGLLVRHSSPFSRLCL